ncbi:MAG: OmpA family protein [Bacteroidota bacterium]
MYLHIKTYSFRLVFLLLVLTLSQSLEAQEHALVNDSEEYRQAVIYMNDGDPSRAVRVFKDLLRRNEKDTAVLLGLARSYSHLDDHEKALYWIGKVVEQDEIQPGESLIRFYVDELRKAGRYEIAKIWLEKIKLDILSRNDTLPVNKTVMFEDTAYIKASSMPFNTTSADFCPVFYKDMLLFYSNHERTTSKPLNLAGDAEADLFAVPVTNSEGPTLAQNINKLMGYGYYEGSFAFYHDYQKSILSKYLAGNENLLTGKNKLSGLKLYSAEVDTAANIIDFFDPLPFNIHGFSVAHPNITNDGTLLYFAANIPGGYGGSDIYRSVFEDGIWGPPENLGPSVNSPYDEYFPYNYNGISLFFTSNRPAGMGGFDIYKQQLSSLSGDQPAANLGAPINSEGDDFCMIVSSDGRSGYFTSNRSESKGKEDVFMFELQTVSIEEIIDEILQGDQFENVTVSFDQKHTIIVEPLNRNSATEENSISAGFQEDDTATSRHSSVKKSENGQYQGPTIELKIDNAPEENLPGVDITDDDFVSNQNLRLIVRDRGKVIYQVPLPEKLNMSTFFDVREKVKTAVNALAVEKSAAPPVNMEKPIATPARIFRVQVAASTSPIPMGVLKKRYTGSRDIFEFKEEGWYKYAIGDFDNYFEAVRVKEECGVDDAFIAAYTEKRKVPLMQLLVRELDYSPSKMDLDPQQIETIVSLNYAFNETMLSQSMKNRLDAIFSMLNAGEELKLLIQGMADYYGSEAYNYALARERANSIREYLLTQGIPDGQITVVSLGESLKPLEVFDPQQYKAEEEAGYRKVEVVVYRP